MRGGDVVPIVVFNDCLEHRSHSQRHPCVYEQWMENHLILLWRSDISKLITAVFHSEGAFPGTHPTF